jgi:hypothetical protein
MNTSMARLQGMLELVLQKASILLFLMMMTGGKKKK